LEAKSEKGTGMPKYHVIAGLALSTAIATPAYAQDFYMPPPSTVDSSVMNLSRENLRHQRETGARQRAIRARTDNSKDTAVPETVMAQVESASMAVLQPEYNRRAAADGKVRAKQWLNASARSVGLEMGKLRPEYLRRVQSQGRASADAWYVEQARDASERQFASMR